MYVIHTLDFFFNITCILNFIEILLSLLSRLLLLSGVIDISAIRYYFKSIAVSTISMYHTVTIRCPVSASQFLTVMGYLTRGHQRTDTPDRSRVARTPACKYHGSRGTLSVISATEAPNISRVAARTERSRAEAVV